MESKPTKVEKENKQLRYKIKELKKRNRERERLPETALIYKQQNDGLIGANSELSKKNRLLKHKLKTAKETIEQRDCEIESLKKTIEQLKPEKPETIEMKHKDIGA